MRSIFLFAASAASLFAQLPAPNAAGVTMGHMHLMVGDADAHKKIWVDMLGAEVKKAGTLEILKLPGVFMVVGRARTAPTEGNDGSTVNHLGVLVNSYPEWKAKLTAAGFKVVLDNAENKQVIVELPEKVRVEFSEDPTVKTPTPFHHIHVYAANREKLRDWYVKTFGATPGTRRNFLSAIIPGGRLDFSEVQTPLAPTKGRSLDHIGFEVKDLEAFCKKLEAEGVKFELPFRDVPAIGLKIAFLVDPEGTRIELTEGLAKH